MTPTSEKATLISELHGLSQTPAMKYVIAFIDILIEESRIDNDTAEPPNVLRNQGGIAVLGVMREYIMRGPAPGVGVIVPSFPISDRSSAFRK